jgi:predicted porin
MKKLLIATAALAMVAGTAQAQSNVSIYGNIDMSWQSVDNDAGATGAQMSRNALSSSRLGFRGTEDLGGGLKAGFVLEAAINAGNGQVGAAGTQADATAAAVPAATTFDRAAYVSLSSAKLGELRLGRTDVTLVNDIDVMVSQMGNMGNFNTGINNITIGDNIDNTVAYYSPTFNGFQLQAGYASANSAPSSSTGLITEATTGDITAFMVSYVAGPVKAYAGKSEKKGATTAADGEETTYGLAYDAGFASFGAARQTGQASSTAQYTQTSLTVAVPVKALGSGVKVHAGYHMSEDDLAANKDINTTRLAITKALSKRTTVYAAYASADNDSSVAGAIAGKTVTTTAVGINHAF